MSPHREGGTKGEGTKPSLGGGFAHKFSNSVEAFIAKQHCK